MSGWLSSGLVVLVCSAVCARPARADESPGADMDYGPFLSGSLDRDPAVSARHTDESTEQLPDHQNNLAAKAINVRLRGGAGGGRGDVEAAVAFDTDLLRYAAGWTGGFVNLDKTHLTSEKGAVPLSPAGRLAFTTPLRTPGWTTRPGDGFDDPRPRPFGPLPRPAGHYKGLYRHGDRVVFRYTVGAMDVLDMPGLLAAGGGRRDVVFTRTLRLGPCNETTRVLLHHLVGAHYIQHRATQLGVRADAGDAFFAIQRTGRGRAVLSWQDPYAVLVIGPHAKPVRVRVGFSRVEDPKAVMLASAPPDDLDLLTAGGPARWPQEQTTVGQVAEAKDAPYVVDELTLPFDNPWKSWMRLTGFDFFKDGSRAAVCTWSGDVWVVSGIDDKLERLTWRRFAAGLYEPLGLRIVDDKIYVRGRDQITRLHDLNADGEADFYENFNNDGVVSANYHGFAFDLHTDTAGHFYYTRVGHRMSPELPGQGSLVRVSPDGSRSEVIACGFRAANGVGVGPDGQLTTADNQGHWTPSSRINLVKPGGFYGFVPHSTAAGQPPRDTDYDPPLCWIPQSLDNSGGSQAWVPAGETRWGPLAGRMLHTSYGTASLLLVFADEARGAEGDDRHRAGDPRDKGKAIKPIDAAPARSDHPALPRAAGVVRFPLRFASGVMRARFNPADGQLYLAGLKGWQTAGARDGTLCRVRYTGAPVNLPAGLRVLSNGIELIFTELLDPETANDPESFGVQQWNYRWSPDYGSPDLSAADPTRQGRDDVPVKAATLRADGKTVFLEIPNLKPVMQMGFRYDLDTAEGATITDTLYLTLHRVPD